MTSGGSLPTEQPTNVPAIRHAPAMSRPPRSASPVPQSATPLDALVAGALLVTFPVLLWITAHPVRLAAVAGASIGAIVARRGYRLVGDLRRYGRLQFELPRDVSVTVTREASDRSE